MPILICIVVSTILYIGYWVFVSKPSSVKGFIIQVLAVGVGGVIGTLVATLMGIAQLNEIWWRVLCLIIGNLIAYVLVHIVYPKMVSMIYDTETIETPEDKETRIFGGIALLVLNTGLIALLLYGLYVYFN